MEDRAFVPSGVIAVSTHDLRKWKTLRTIDREREGVREERRGGGELGERLHISMREDSSYLYVTKLGIHQHKRVYLYNLSKN